MTTNKKQYHYFYKITNNINGHFYYGVHNTNNLEDGYMGSGTRLRMAYKKYGMENFSKEILKFFNSANEAFEYESEIVTETLVKDDNCYNVQEGGKGLHSINTVMVKNIYSNETFRCHKSDIRLQTGELVGITKGMVVVKDKDNNHLYVSIDDERYKNGELVSVLKGNKHSKEILEKLSEKRKGKIAVKDKQYNYFLVDITDPRYLNNELVSISKNRKSVYDKNGKHFFVEENDPRLLSGELLPKQKKEYTGNYINLHKKLVEIKHQQGEKNSQYGTCWIHNNKENKKIQKEDLEYWLSNGWINGRKMKF